MRVPVGALALVLGTATGLVAISLALSKSCGPDRYYDCGASHPTLSMTLRHASVRRPVVPLLLASQACLFASDLALWALVTAERALTPLAHAACIAGIASVPAMSVLVAANPREDAHLHAATAWCALRMVQGSLVLPGVWRITRGSVPFAVVNALRTVLAAILVGVGARLVATAPGGDMDGRLQFAAIRMVLAFHASLIPESAGVRLCVGRGGDGGESGGEACVALDVGTRNVLGWWRAGKDGGRYAVRDEDEEGGG